MTVSNWLYLSWILSIDLRNLWLTFFMRFKSRTSLFDNLRMIVNILLTITIFDWLYLIRILRSNWVIIWLHYCSSLPIWDIVLPSLKPFYFILLSLPLLSDFVIPDWGSNSFYDRANIDWLAQCLSVYWASRVVYGLALIVLCEHILTPLQDLSQCRRIL